MPSSPIAPVACEEHENPTFPQLTTQQVLDAARVRYGRLSVGSDEFARHLLSLGCTGTRLIDRAALYLCLACSVGDADACAALERVHLSKLRYYLAGMRLAAPFLEDVCQEVRRRLLVGPSPKILTYRGRGPFQGWLRRIARAAAIDLLRRRRSEQLRCKAFATAFSRTGCIESPEELTVREGYARAIASALSVSILALAPSEREFLKLHYVQGSSIDDLAQLFSIDRSTAARRIGRMVRKVRTRVRRELQLQVGRVVPADLVSLGAQLPEYCEVDVERMLKAS